VVALNLHRRHLTQEQKRAVIAAALKKEPEKSNRQHVEALGVSDNTVRSVRGELEGTAQIAQLDRTTGKDGKSRPASKPPTPEPAQVGSPDPMPNAVLRNDDQNKQALRRCSAFVRDFVADNCFSAEVPWELLSDQDCERLLGCLRDSFELLVDHITARRRRAS
jgi:hypothetical protein